MASSETVKDLFKRQTWKELNYCNWTMCSEGKSMTGPITIDKAKFSMMK
jgi:hypothetical protein